MTSLWISLGTALLSLGQTGTGAILQTMAGSSTAQPAAQARPVQPRLVQPVRTPQAPTYLANRVDQLGRGFSGSVGIAVKSVNEGWSTDWNGNVLTPQQSVSK